jgi:P27 family predicted phage terminase small subunit
MRGQRRPTAIKILEGEPNKDRINFNEPQPETKTTAPKFLNKYGRNEWKRLYPEYERLGLVTKADRALFATYCQVWGRLQEAEEEYKKSTFLVRNKKGGINKNPLLSIINECINQLHALGTQFGMTPVSRSRINSTPKAKEEDPMEALLNCPASER